MQAMRGAVVAWRYWSCDVAGDPWARETAPQPLTGYLPPVPDGVSCGAADAVNLQAVLGGPALAATCRDALLWHTL